MAQGLRLTGDNMLTTSNHGIVTLTGTTFEKNIDGTASVKNNKVYSTGTVSIPTVITAIKQTGM